jgi:hypothetical protein
MNNKSRALVLSTESRHSRGYRIDSKPTSPRPSKSKGKRAGANPLGRLDVALGRLLNVAVMGLAPPEIKTAYALCKPVVEVAIRDVVGPGTATGSAAKNLIKGLHVMARTVGPTGPIGTKGAA